MRPIPALALCVLFVPTRAFADIPCTPMQALANQNRTHMKHRTPPSQNPGMTLITVQQVIAATPASGVSQPGFKTRDTPLDPRELQVITLKGELWRVNIEANDCDFHLEISETGGGQGDDRIIVEIPQGPNFAAARTALLQALKANGVTLKAQTPLAQPIHVQVLGFSFYDAWHFSSNNPQRGHGHGSAQVASLWEIHPVFAIIFPQS